MPKGKHNSPKPKLPVPKSALKYYESLKNQYYDLTRKEHGRRKEEKESSTGEQRKTIQKD
jgi:hypothetical protein